MNFWHHHLSTISSFMIVMMKSTAQSMRINWWRNILMDRHHNCHRDCRVQLMCMRFLPKLFPIRIKWNSSVLEEKTSPCTLPTRCWESMFPLRLLPKERNALRFLDEETGCIFVPMQFAKNLFMKKEKRSRLIWVFRVGKEEVRKKIISYHVSSKF